VVTFHNGGVLVWTKFYFLCFCKKRCKEKWCIVFRIMGCCMLKIKLKVSSYRPCKHVANVPYQIMYVCQNQLWKQYDNQLPSGKMHYYQCIFQIPQSCKSHNLPHPGHIACCSACNSWPLATKALHTICGNNTSIVSSSWWWAYKCPKHVEQIISAIKHSAASSWFSSLRLYYDARTNIHQIQDHVCLFVDYLIMWSLA